MEKTTDMETLIDNSQIKTRLHPAHYADLQKSGLSDDTIAEAGFVTVAPGDIHKELGFNHEGILNVMKIPYPGSDGFARFKVSYRPDHQGRKPKYIQKKDTGNHLYIQAKVRPSLSDPTIPITITEGEKKAAKGCQEGVDCIGLSGLWNWSDGRQELIKDFDLINLNGRKVFLVPDNDWLSPDKHGYEKNLKGAVYSLAYKLKARGASVSIVELPQGQAKGLDDYLLDHAREDLEALPVLKIETLAEKIVGLPEGANFRESVHPIILEIAQLGSESEKDVYVRLLSDKTGISKRNILKDIKLFTAGKPHAQITDENVLIAHPAYEVSHDFVSLGFKETVVVDDVPQDRNLYIVSHDDNIFVTNKPVFQLGDFKIVINEGERVLISLNDKWTKKRLQDFIKNPLSPEGLYNEVKEAIKQYIEFQKVAFYGLIAAWIIATYFHRIFYAFPFLSFPGKKQSGKTRTLDVLSLLSFNAFKIKGVSIPSLADSIDGQRCTFIMDQAEVLSDKRNVELLGILADSYTIGGGKRRIVSITNKSRRVLEFETYAPKAFATTRELDTDLKDRTIEIVMIRAEREYPEPVPFLRLWQNLRDKLYRLLLTKWPEVREIYSTAGQGVTQRVRELWRPIETILILEKVPGEEKKAIKETFLESVIETQTGLTELEDALIQALRDLLEFNPEGEFTATDIVGKMCIPETEKFKKREQTKWVGRALNRLCLYVRKAGRVANKRKYFFVREHIENIASRYRIDGIDGTLAIDSNASEPGDANHKELLAVDGTYANVCQHQEVNGIQENPTNIVSCQHANDANDAIKEKENICQEGCVVPQDEELPIVRGRKLEVS
jgi:hypothetical protein